MTQYSVSMILSCSEAPVVISDAEMPGSGTIAYNQLMNHQDIYVATEIEDTAANVLVPYDKICVAYVTTIVGEDTAVEDAVCNETNSSGGGSEDGN